MSEDLDGRLDLDNMERCNAITFSEYGDLAFVSVPGNNRIIVLDGISGGKESDFETGLVPDGSVLDHASRKL